MRAASTYRGARRNVARTARKLGVWREFVALEANNTANIVGRAKQANSAREHAAKAFVKAGALATPHTMIDAFTEFYSGEKRTRVVSRILRDLKQQSRSNRRAA